MLTVISCVIELVPSETVTVALYEDFVSKSGADTKVSTPEELSMLISEPEME